MEWMESGMEWMESGMGWQGRKNIRNIRNIGNGLGKNMVYDRPSEISRYPGSHMKAQHTS